MTSRHIKNVAIVGSTGNSGSFMTKSLLDTGKFNITAITRADSQSKPLEGVRVTKVDYSDEGTLVTALQDQDALIITLSISAAPDTQEKLIRAAGEAGVQWIMPNGWGPDITSHGLRADVYAFAELQRTKEYIEELGQSSYIALTNGFWYEWSLAIPDAYGFDIGKKQATFFDDGAKKISTSTWPQVGRAVAAILSLPVEAASGPSLEQYKNKSVCISSFTVSQRDMLKSILRVTGDKESDWTIKKVPSSERVAEAQKAVQQGDRRAYVHVMYTRVFYDDANGNFGSKVANEVLGLPQEDIDEATAVAIERSKKPLW